MEDQDIIALYWERSERAIEESARKYGSYCRAIAYRVLGSQEDSEECVNDTYWRAWNALPPEKPQRLGIYLGKITRNLSIDRFERSAAAKRGGGVLPLALSELGECVSGGESEEQAVDALVVSEVLNRFLGGLTAEQRKVFLRRYWYFCTVREIAKDFHMSESKVKMLLLRLRQQLKAQLEQEGIVL